MRQHAELDKIGPLVAIKDYSPEVVALPKYDQNATYYYGDGYTGTLLRTKTGKRHLYYTFDNILSPVPVLFDTNYNNSNHQSSLETHGGHGDEWYGCEPEDITRLFLHGDDDIGRSLMDIADDVSASLVANHYGPVYCRGYSGIMLDPLATIGQVQMPVAWVDKRRGMGVDRNVTLCVEMSAAWSVSVPNYKWRGIAAISVANVLERSGYNVRIFAIDTTRDIQVDDLSITDLLMTRTIVKDFSDPICAASCIVALGMPVYFRRKLFRVIQYNLDEQVDGSFGYAMRGGSTQGLAFDMGLDDITQFPIFDGEIGSEEDARLYVRDFLKEFFGGELGTESQRYDFADFKKLRCERIA